MTSRGQWVSWNSASSLLPCGFWGSNSLRQVWWQAPLPVLPAHLPARGSLLPKQHINNFPESLQGRLRHRGIFSPGSGLHPHTASAGTVFRRCQLIAPHPSRPACGWLPGPSVSQEGLVLTAQPPTALDAGARWDFKVPAAQLFTPTQRV